MTIKFFNWNENFDKMKKEYFMKSEANNKQIAGDHYKSSIQHWDYVIANDLDYFQAQITKYVTRWKKKNGITDLEKALHFLEKYVEVEKATKPSKSNNFAHTIPHADALQQQYLDIRSNKQTEMKSPFGYHEELEITKHPLDPAEYK